MKKVIAGLIFLMGSFAVADTFNESDSNRIFGLLTAADLTSPEGNTESSHLVDVVCSWDRLQMTTVCSAKRNGQNVSLSVEDSEVLMDILERVVGSNEVGAIANRAIEIEEIVCSKQNGSTEPVCTYKK